MVLFSTYQNMKTHTALALVILVVGCAGTYMASSALCISAPGAYFLYLLPVVLAAIVQAAGSEKYDWNRGVSASCRTAWNIFDTDSQGGRMYKCGCSEVHHLVVSYAVDRVRSQ